jgi:hypothetical protein
MDFDASYCAFKGQWAASIVSSGWNDWNGSKGCAPVAEKQPLEPFQRRPRRG